MSGEVAFWKFNVDLRFTSVNFCSYVRHSDRWITDYQLDQRNFVLFSRVVSFYFIMVSGSQKCLTVQ